MSTYEAVITWSAVIPAGWSYTIVQAASTALDTAPGVRHISTTLRGSQTVTRFYTDQPIQTSSPGEVQMFIAPLVLVLIGAIAALLAVIGISEVSSSVTEVAAGKVSLLILAVIAGIIILGSKK